MSPSTTSRITTDQDEIRRWAEERGARPAAAAAGESDEDPGIVCLGLPGDNGASLLEEIDWDEWFNRFHRHKLALLYQEETASGERSSFNKIVRRETAEEVEQAVGGKGRSATRHDSSKSNGSSQRKKAGRSGATVSVKLSSGPRPGKATRSVAITLAKSNGRNGRGSGAEKSGSVRVRAAGEGRGSKSTMSKNAGKRTRS